MSDLALDAVDLVLDDRDPQMIFDAALDAFEALAPDARVRNGSVEALLMEAMSVASADVIYALNRFVGAVVEGVLNLYEVPRFAGASASGVVTLTLDGTRTLTVAAGQRLVDPGTGLVLQVTADTSGSSVSTLALPVATLLPGGAGNAIAAGAAVDIVDAIPYAVSAAVTTAFGGGADAEDDAAYVLRARAVLARVTSSLVLPEHFVAYALEDARVGRAAAIDLYEPPSGTPGSDLGHLTVVVYGHGGQLSTEVREELRVSMSAICASMITTHVEPATIVTQAITLTAHALPGYSTTAVRDAIAAALTAWCSPDVWPWGRDIMATEIIDVAADVTGVDYVDAVAVPAGTVTIAADELAMAGTLTISVI